MRYVTEVLDSFSYQKRKKMSIGPYFNMSLFLEISKPLTKLYKGIIKKNTSIYLISSVLECNFTQGKNETEFIRIYFF